MEKKWYLANMKDDEVSSDFLSLCMERATSFRAYFPDDPDLIRGKEVFCSLPDATSQAWEGMRGCVVVSAPLDFLSRELLRSWMDRDGERRPLWQYEFLDGDEVFLRVEDFSVYLVHAAQDDLQAFQERGIDTNLWGVINLEGDAGITVQPFSEEELRGLAEDLHQVLDDEDDLQP